MSALQPGSRIAIAGGGCAGCSLACEILARCPGVHVSVFEPAASLGSRRTWCFWDVRPHRFADAIQTRWNRVLVRSARIDVEVDASSYPYSCIRAEDFFRVAREAMSSESCTIRLGTSVEAISERDDGVELSLRTGDGASTERFSHVFDGRPPAQPSNPSNEPMLLQHFGGIEIDTSSTPVDPSVATLMDFGVSQQYGAHFMYVLPFRADRVLVESTFLTTGIPEGIDYESNAADYATSVLGVDPSRIVYRESGVLPMTLRPLGPASTPRIWAVGTRAGIGRASSGYAFDAIQYDARRIVDALLANAPRPRPPRPRVLGALDRVLLSLLDAQNDAAPDLFSRLFRDAPTDGLIRFLGDVPRPLDYLAVMWAMPKAQVIRHVLTHPSAWPRLVG